MRIAATEVRPGDVILNGYGQGFRVESIVPNGESPTFHTVDDNGLTRVLRADGYHKVNVRR
ncbi:hypothetical protein CPT_Shaeky_047 [Streptomyces phage Shaeky]|uniref:Uncharacterized protein n=1 Tax=Streptomyces phage Shaeky TaxID=2767586 RepID=A0A873WVQ1_9CAUD|nr:hypothetical protein CPT_Shaeky_047 [Streptomyces phage Shaeky]